MLKHKKWIILALSIVLLIGIIATVFGFIIPYYGARSNMPNDGILTVRQQEDGSLLVSWPESVQADYYYIEVENGSDSIHEEFVYGSTSCTLSKIPYDTELTMRVSSVKKYGNKARIGKSPLEVTTFFKAHTIGNMIWRENTDAKKINVSFQMQDGDTCQLYMAKNNSELILLKTLYDCETELDFSEIGDIEMPGFDDEYTFGFAACHNEPGLIFYGYPSTTVTIVRDDLFGRDLNLVCTENDYNVYTFTWDETKCEHYEIQRMDKTTSEWTTVCDVAKSSDLTYTTPHLPAFSDFTYRVVAVGGQTMPSSDFAAISEEIIIRTKESPIFCTIWPVSDLKAYSDPQKTESVGKVKTGTAYCVIEEHNGMFGIRLNNQISYIDSNYCMINLPEYIGDICNYNITNSYSSIYMVHEFEIPKVTDVVTAGYGKIKFSSGEYLVPLLYPTAQKLLIAAQNAMEQGYRIKIYDSFRPNVATNEIFNLTSSIFNDPLPSNPFTNKNVTDLPSVDKAAGEVLTYRRVMTNNSYGINSFLAQGRSMHNLGIALDLTLEDLDTGKEIQMQTSMHDLSCYSVLGKNNNTANTLASIMNSAGFGDLVSEWWHFQDNEVRKELSLPTVYNGVSGACWMADDYGWKYRRDNGTYYTNTTVTISGTEYTLY